MSALEPGLSWSILCTAVFASVPATVQAEVAIVVANDVCTSRQTSLQTALDSFVSAGWKLVDSERLAWLDDRQWDFLYASFCRTGSLQFFASRILKITKAELQSWSTRKLLAEVDLALANDSDTSARKEVITLRSFVVAPTEETLAALEFEFVESKYNWEQQCTFIIAEEAAALDALSIHLGDEFDKLVSFSRPAILDIRQGERPQFGDLTLADATTELLLVRNEALSYAFGVPIEAAFRYRSNLYVPPPQEVSNEVQK